MLDKQLRQIKEAVLNPAAKAVGGVLSPMAITLMAGLAGLAAALAAGQGWYELGLGLWIANRLLDGLDGAVARATQKSSDLGGYYDIIIDMIVYAAVPAMLAYADGSVETWMALAFMLGAFYVNAGSWMYLSAVLEKRAGGAAASGEMTSVTMPGGLVEGAETVLFYTLFFLFPGLLAVLFGVFGLMVIYTSVQRLLWAARNLKG